MPWGKKSTDHNTSGLTPAQKKTFKKISTDVNQEAKRRLQKNRKAQSNDGNEKSR
jgi:hypothetical protein